MNRTPIEWADYSSNPIKARRAGVSGVFGEPTGRQGWACVHVSDGCKHCYAATLNRRLGTGLDYTVPALAQVDVFLDERELQRVLTFRPKATEAHDSLLPLASGAGLVIPREVRPTPLTFKNRRSRPTVFVADMTDLFGGWVPDEWLDRLFAVFALRPDVDWLLLTKRPERMRAYLTAKIPSGPGLWEGKARRNIHSFYVRSEQADDYRLKNGVDSFPFPNWPLPNVWLGTSVEDQAAADKRIPELLATPAAVRFISAEPLLGPVQLPPYIPFASEQGYRAARGALNPNRPLAILDWVIVGGESGPQARPCDIGWIRSIVAQCQAAGVATFVKQLGSKPLFSLDDLNATACDGVRFTEQNNQHLGGRPILKRLKDRKGGLMDEWPEDLRVREMPQ